MTQSSSAIPTRVARIAATVFALAAVLVLAHGATAAPLTSDPAADLAVSLVQTSTATPLTGTLGFTAEVRFPADASSVAARLQMKRNGGRLVYQRTQYLDKPLPGSNFFTFSRPLSGLGLDPGIYPVTLTIRADVGGSSVSTEVATQLRIYDSSDTPVSAVVLVKVHSRPLANPSGRFATDPAGPEAVRVRDQVDGISTLVLTDPNARLSLAVPPLTIEEWKRIASRGYTLAASGTVVPATDPTPIAYAATLTNLQQALLTGRLELLTMGYADPNLADLTTNKMASDTSVQYDAGLSAIFASLEATPSGGTAPAGGTVPKGVQHALLSRQVTYAFVDADATKTAKRGAAATGVYPVSGSTLRALVVDAGASRGLESGDASATLARTFDRLGASSSPQPVIVRVDLDDTVTDATGTVGVALSTLEATPWIRLKLAAQVRPPKTARPVALAATPTKNAPAEFWPRVRSARAHANGMIAILTTSDDQATSSETNSLIAEASEWSEPAARWAYATTGIGFADAALKTANSVFDTIKVSATSVTLAGSTGEVPVNIQNGSKKTMTVAVTTKTSTGVSVVGSPTVSTKLAPGETFVQVPIDMQGAVQGKISVEVLAGNVVVARRTVAVHRSYLDRLALVGGIVLVLGGMLVWIVLKVRRSPDVGDEFDDEYTDDSDAEHEEDETNTRSDSDEADPARYTEPHSDAFD